MQEYVSGTWQHMRKCSRQLAYRDLALAHSAYPSEQGPKGADLLPSSAAPGTLQQSLAPGSQDGPTPARIGITLAPFEENSVHILRLTGQTGKPGLGQRRGRAAYPRLTWYLCGTLR